MYPKRLDLEITRKCKFRCGICSLNSENKEYHNEVSLEDLFLKIDEFYRLGGKEVSISGGEPIERGIEFLYSLISHCKDLGLYVRMYTVGYGFQNKFIVNSLYRAGLNSVYISVEGTREIDELYKGIKGSYDIALKSIELFLRHKIEVVLHFTPTRINYIYLPNVVMIAKKFRIKKIRIMALVEQGRGWTNRDIFSMNEENMLDFNKILRTIIQQNKNITIQLSGNFGKIKSDSNDCILKKDRLVITSDGRIIPSFALRMNENKELSNTSFNLGIIGKNTIDEVWNLPIMSDARTTSGCGCCSVCSKTG